MDILEGLLLVNGVDIFKEYGAYLVEEKPGENRNYSSLLKPPPAKGHTAVSFRERDGEELPGTLLPAWEPRDVDLHFAIVAPDGRGFMERYSAFLAFLKAGKKGWLELYLQELGRSFRLYYKDCTDYSQLTGFDGEVAARFSVRFREPAPAF